MKNSVSSENYALTGVLFKWRNGEKWKSEKLLDIFLIFCFNSFRINCFSALFREDVFMLEFT